MQALSPLFLDATRVMFVLIHLIAVAIAVGMVFWQDIALINTRHMTPDQFRTASIRVTQALIVLWISGLAIIGLDTGFDLSILATKPKIQAKLLVVTLLTLNGWALHQVAFPALMGTRKNSVWTAKIVVSLGAISVTSWGYAIFLGVAKPLTQLLGFAGFISLYASMLVLGIATALMFVRPHVERILLRATGFVPALIAGINHPERRSSDRRKQSATAMQNTHAENSRDTVRAGTG